MSRILMVDDSPTEIVVAKKALESKGHTVITASNGADGVAKAKAEKERLEREAAERAAQLELA